jgi:hypothetical protein
VTWSNNPTHSGNHIFSGNITVSGSATLNGNTVIGDAGTDTLTIAPNAVTWSNNPTHSGNHIFSGTLNVAGLTTLDGLTTTGNAILGNAATDTLDVGAGGLIKNASGQVGIGKTPTEVLDVLAAAGRAHFNLETSFAGQTTQIKMKATAGTAEWALTVGTGSTNNLAFTQVGVAERMRIDASGNVGIGTASPTVASGKGLVIFDSSGVPRLQLRNPTTGDTSTDGSSLFLSGLDFGIENREAGNIIFYTSGAERLRIDASGNVGIGVTPTASQGLLQVAGGIKSTTGLNITGNGGFYNAANKFGLDVNVSATRLYASGPDTATKGSYEFHGISSNGSVDTIHMQIDSSGNVGIGVTPTYKLDVPFAVRLNSIERTAAGQLYINASDAAGFVTVNTAGAERMRIDSSGNVGIGAAPDTVARLRAESADPTRGIVGLLKNSASTTGAQVQVSQSGISDWAFGQPGGVNAFAFWSGRTSAADGTERLRIDASGNIVPGANNAQTLGSTGLRWSTVNSVLGNFSGVITASGGVTGALTGNASTATTLQTARTINGVSFDGSANITVAAAAGTLTGATLAAGVTASSLTSVAAGATVGGIEIGFRKIPAASVTTGAFVAADSGKCVYATAGVTVPNSVMAQGDAVTIYNNTASAITITATITTLRLAGTATTGNRTLAARGVATVLHISGTEAVISGAGLT